MSEYRRWRVAGGTYFFTVVTHQREPLFSEADARRNLREAFTIARKHNPFDVLSIVLLPDHFHVVLELPLGDCDYTVRIRQIKTLFTRELARCSNTKKGLSRSRSKRGEHNVWQRRFYEHTVRDEEDLSRCVDYIHVNPVKHKLVKRVRDWPWSSVHRWVKEGHYPIDWGCSDEWFGDEFKRFE